MRTGDPEFAHDRKGQRVEAAPARPARVCGVPGCDRPHKAHNLCELHATRRKRGQDLLAPPARREHARSHDAALRSLAKKLVRLQVVEDQEAAQRLVAALVLVWPATTNDLFANDSWVEVMQPMAGISVFTDPL